MSRTFSIAVVSDIHYAAAEERARCANSQFWRKIQNPAVRIIGRAYHGFIWLRDRGAHNDLLDAFLANAGRHDLVVANGDFSCNTGHIGAGDPAAFASAEECLGKLRARFGPDFRATIGDHELGKSDLFSGRGTMSLESWRRVTEGLGIEPFWRVQFGKYILLGITSSLVALPIYKPDTRDADAPEWERLRQKQLDNIRAAFDGLRRDERVILFCHDPSALPFLWREATVRERICHVEQTIVGHLHTNLILQVGQALSGLPIISFLGKGAMRISSGVSEAKLWKPFHVRLCPALTGIQLLKDGGWLSAELDADAKTPAHFEFHPIKW
ncbi:MAG: metallophosphoesterase [Limisphaerales bacterium]